MKKLISYKPKLITAWFWNILEESNGDYNRYEFLLAQLSKRELFILYIIFLKEVNNKPIESNFALTTEVLNLYADITYKQFVRLCYDSRGAIYPEAVSSEWFWDIIRKSQKDSQKLGDILSLMTKEQIFHFYYEFTTVSGSLTDSLFTSNTSLSEDGIDELTKWIVSQGKEYYLKTWNEPTLIKEAVKSETDENLYFVIEEVYEEKFNDDIWDFNNKMFG